MIISSEGEVGTLMCRPVNVAQLGGEATSSTVSVDAHIPDVSSLPATPSLVPTDAHISEEALTHAPLVNRSSSPDASIQPTQNSLAHGHSEQHPTSTIVSRLHRNGAPIMIGCGVLLLLIASSRIPRTTPRSDKLGSWEFIPWCDFAEGRCNRDQCAFSHA